MKNMTGEAGDFKIAFKSDDPQNESTDAYIDEDGSYIRLPRSFMGPAFGGDRESIQALAKIGADLLEKEIISGHFKLQESLVMCWIGIALTAIADGETPDIAFKFKTPGRKGNKKQYSREFRNIQLALEVIMKKKEEPGDSLEEIFEDVANKNHKSASTVKAAYQEHQSQLNQTLSTLVGACDKE